MTITRNRTVEELDVENCAPDGSPVIYVAKGALIVAGDRSAQLRRRDHEIEHHRFHDCEGSPADGLKSAFRQVTIRQRYVATLWANARS